MYKIVLKSSLFLICGYKEEILNLDLIKRQRLIKYGQLSQSLGSQKNHPNLKNHLFHICGTKTLKELLNLNNEYRTTNIEF